MTDDERKVQAEFIREMTAREYLERQRASHQQNMLAGGCESTTIVDTIGMVREIARLRALVNAQGLAAKVKALPAYMLSRSGALQETTETVALSAVLDLLK